MNRRVRVIPILSILEGQLVKTVRFKKPNYLGDPINAIKILNDKEVDEIIVVDIRASKNDKEPNYMLIKEMAEECFMPLAYGGGISSFEIAKKVFDLGVEKLIINSNLNNLKLISQISRTYGEQSVVASIDVGKNFFGKKVLKFKSATTSIKRELVSFSNELINSGVGEILVNDIEREGTFRGYGIDNLLELTSCVSVPVIACGGAASILDYSEAVLKGGASAVAASSMFVYKNNDTQSILINYPNQIELKEKFYTKL